MNADDRLAAAERQQRLDNRVWDLEIAIRDAQRDFDTAQRKRDVEQRDEALARLQHFTRQRQQLNPLREMVRMIRAERGDD